LHTFHRNLSHFGTLSRQRLNQIKLANIPSRLAPLTTGAFNRLGQYASSPGHRAYCYAELAVSSVAVAVTIASTHFAYPQRNHQAQLVQVAWLNTKMVYPRTFTHLSTNPPQCRVTLLIQSMMLPLDEAAISLVRWLLVSQLL